MVERVTVNDVVAGSSPASSATYVVGFYVRSGPSPRLRCIHCEKLAVYRNGPVGVYILECVCHGH